MKLSAGILGLVVSLAMAHGSFAAKKEPRLIAFAGNYSGTMSYAGMYTGATTAKFTASKKKDVGTLSLATILVVGGTGVVFNETFQINKKQIVYSIVADGSAGTGVGTANVGKKSITYSSVLTVGSSTYFLSGTISHSGKRGLLVNEILSTTGVTLPISYTLTKQGKK